MLSISSAAELNPAAVIYKLPDQIHWSPVEPAARKAPSWSAIRPSPVSMSSITNGPRAIISAGHISIPTTAYIVVLQGTWWVGSGPKFDPANTTPMPAGSFVTHFGKQVHWDGAKDEEAVLLIMGEGPATATQAEENSAGGYAYARAIVPTAEDNHASSRESAIRTRRG